MKYFPYENYKLTTKLSVEEIKNRLCDIIEPKKYFRLSIFHSVEKKAYEGKVMSCRFKINRIMKGRNSWRPTITGEIENNMGATIIHIRMKMVFITSVIMLIFFGGLLISLFANLFGGVSEKIILPIGLVELIFLIILLYGTMTICFKLESIKSKTFLSDLLEAEEISE